MSYETPNVETHAYQGVVSFGWDSNNGENQRVDFTYHPFSVLLTEAQNDAVFQAIVDALSALEHEDFRADKTTSVSGQCFPTEPE